MTAGRAPRSRPPQNIYDDPAFFAGYSTMDRFGEGWTRAMEHPDFMALLPNVAGTRVLDLGCGAGQLAYYLAEQGAASVIATDVSERMLELARTERAHPRITYRRESMEDAAYRPGQFDLVVSSLAIHYVEDYRGLARRIADWLVPGGLLVFSTEHPIFSACDAGKGWAVDEHGRKLHWQLDNYMVEGVREQRWFVDGVRRYHRPMSTLLNGLIDAGFAIERVIEPVPSEEFLRRRPEGSEEFRRPTFLLIRARKA